MHEGQSKGCSDARSRGKCGGREEQAMRAPCRAQRAPGGAACSPSSSRSMASRSARARIMETDLRQAETAGEHRGGVAGRSTMLLRGCFLRGAQGEAACEQAEQSEHMVMEGMGMTSSLTKHTAPGPGRSCGSHPGDALHADLSGEPSWVASRNLQGMLERPQQGGWGAGEAVFHAFLREGPEASDMKSLDKKWGAQLSGFWGP